MVIESVIKSQNKLLQAPKCILALSLQFLSELDNKSDFEHVFKISTVFLTALINSSLFTLCSWRFALNWCL